VAHDEALAERVRKLLAGRRGVVEKKLMGHLAFMVNGAMCCAVGEDGLLVRVGADAREEVLAKPHVEPMVMRGRTMTGFFRVKNGGLRTAAALTKWVEGGIKAGAERKKATAKRTKR
jgi:TfoX/Sxy family transcriptional regulator of competence genes